jgi:TPP-dependent 2-oxoacid decarboxylase
MSKYVDCVKISSDNATSFDVPFSKVGNEPATAGFSYEFDIDDVVMLNHHNFKLNETVAEDVTLISIINGIKSIN